MSLTSVKMSEEVWLTCVSHALSTESEEVMGLLLGDINYSDGRGASATALIWGASPQMRSDRRKDRVEINPELLTAAAAQAEKMTLSTGKTTRVIGWYHSHPHITVLPSHVDVRTQASYQLLDQGFIGLIFSCFNEDSQKAGKIQVIAFQSLDGKQKLITPVNNSVDVEASWSSVESARSEGIEHDSVDSKAAKSINVGRRIGERDYYSPADINHSGKQAKSSSDLYVPDDIYESAYGPDGSDMTPSIQEALHRSNMDMSSAEFVRKEVALQVLPTSYLINLAQPLSSFIDMQNVLFQEERSAYNEAMIRNVRDGKVHPLTYMHHSSLYHASLAKLMEYCLCPAISVLQDRQKENEIRMAWLAEEAKHLEAELISRSNDTKRSSPRRLPSQGSTGSSPWQQKQPSPGQDNQWNQRGSSNRRAPS